MKNKRGALEFSFGWIFAILAGVFILALAIYGVTKFINLEKASINAQGATDIGILTNPLESSFETVKRAMITTPAETRIYTNCSNISIFGRQTIRISQKIYNQWSEEGMNITFQNKYIFSDSPVEGKNFYLFSKPFELPFKVADLIYLTSTKDKYCFIDAPIDIQEEIKSLKTQDSKNENLFLKTASNPCPEGSINICFKTAASSCNIIVNRNLKYVQKGEERMNFEGDALMYAAIFSNKDIYECEVNRLMKRAGQLFDIYRDKSNFLFKKTGCTQELDADLIVLGNMIKNFQDSKDLPYIFAVADDVNKKNEWVECKLW
jgi:hypothetical protein